MSSPDDPFAPPTATPIVYLTSVDERRREVALELAVRMFQPLPQQTIDNLAYAPLIVAHAMIFSIYLEGPDGD